MPSDTSSPGSARARRSGHRAESEQLRERRLDRVAEGRGEPPGQGRRRRDRDPLAEDRPHRQLESVDGPGDAETRQPRNRGGPAPGRCQLIGDHVGPGVQVEEASEPGQERGQDRRERGRDLDGRVRTACAEGSTFTQPRALADPHRAKVAIARDATRRPSWPGPPGSGAEPPTRAVADRPGSGSGCPGLLSFPRNGGAARGACRNARGTGH